MESIIFKIIFKCYLWFGREEEKETSIFVVPFIPWLILVCALTEDQAHNPGISGRHSNPLRHPARVGIHIFSSFQNIEMQHKSIGVQHTSPLWKVRIFFWWGRKMDTKWHNLSYFDLEKLPMQKQNENNYLKKINVITCLKYIMVFPVILFHLHGPLIYMPPGERRERRVP